MDEAIACTGTVVKDNGKFGFIQQDNQEEDMFITPAQCEVFGFRLPPLGTRLSYTVAIDQRTGRPRADNVQVADEEEVELVEEVIDSIGDASDDLQPVDWPIMECGVMLRDNGHYGFIARDSGEEDMFVLPAHCQAFHGRLPPLGTHVTYHVVLDTKTGRPRAEEVQPESAASAAGVDVPRIVHSIDARECGVMLRDNGNFGFIARDSGEEDMFVLPAQCQAFHGRLPPLGTRLTYHVVIDIKTGRPRAEEVQPESAASAAGVDAPRIDHSIDAIECGVMLRDNGKFGFIARDGGEEDMFVLPAQCHAFHGRLPPLGTRVTYHVVIDNKTGRPRAEDVQPELGGVGAPRIAHSRHSGFLAGTLVKIAGSCGFIQQDNGEPDLFVLPIHCIAFGGALPPVGTRVTYTVGEDPQKGRPCAENVQLEMGAMLRPQAQAPRHVVVPGVSWQAPPHDIFHSGAIAKESGRFGFIVQDSGEPDIFVLPEKCLGFSGVIPPVGTRVVYKLGRDPEKGRPVAECVQAEAHPPVAYAMPLPHVMGLPAPVHSLTQSGVLIKASGKFGFIQQDNGDPDIFAMPIQCIAFGQSLPAVGTRVTYEVGTDPQKGRPNAENIRPEGAPAAAPVGILCSGTMDKDAGKFGFIKQDTGEDDMFVMPAQCDALGGVLPPLGTRVVYAVSIDPKTGRPRAESVRLEAEGKGRIWGPAKGKGGAYRSQPYGAQDATFLR